MRRLVRYTFNGLTVLSLALLLATGWLLYLRETRGNNDVFIGTTLVRVKAGAFEFERWNATMVARKNWHRSVAGIALGFADFHAHGSSRRAMCYLYLRIPICLVTI
jgi:hypothetical protein